MRPKRQSFTSMPGVEARRAITAAVCTVGAGRRHTTLDQRPARPWILSGVDEPYTYLFVGYASDKAAVRYLSSLHGLVETMRHDHRRRLEARVELAADPEHLGALLASEADLLVYSGHAGVEDGSPYLGGGDESLYLEQLAASKGKGIKATGIVFDCCKSGTDDFVAVMRESVDVPAAYLGCDGTAPYTHGPILLPILLAQLACPEEPPAPHPAAYLDAMRRAIVAARGIWRGRWERWITAVLTPAADSLPPSPRRFATEVPPSQASR